MAAGVEWIFNLLDRASGPATTIEKKMALLEKRIGSVTKAEAAMNGPKKDRLTFQRLGLEMQLDTLKATEKTAAATTGWLSRMERSLVTGYLLGKAVWEVARGAVRAAEAFGGLAINAASFKETNLVAFKTLTGSQAAAERILATGVKIAAETPYETADVISWQKQLLTGGFKESELPTLIKAAGDVGALHNFDKEIVDQVYRNLVRIRGQGKLTGESMHELGAVLPTAKVYDTLGKMYGGKSRDQVLKLQEAGKISSDDALYAIIDTIQTHLSGGQLGKLQTELSRTIPGLWSTLKSRPFEWFLGFEKTQGFQSLKKALGILADGLDPLAEKGGRLAASLQRVADSMLSVFSKVEGADSFDRLLNGATNSLDLLAASLKGLIGGFLESFTNQLSGAMDIFDGKLSPEQFDKITEAFKRLGGAFGWAAGKLVQFVDAAASLTTIFSGAANWDTSNYFGRFLALSSAEQEKKSWWGHAEDASGLGFLRRAIQAGQTQDRVDAQVESIKAGIPVQTPRSLPASIGSRNQSINVTVNAPGATSSDANQIGKTVSDAVRDAGEQLFSSEPPLYSSEAIGQGAY